MLDLEIGPGFTPVVAADEAEAGYESARFDQALKAAGVNPKMLNAMDKAALAAALSMDNTVFEEGNAFSAFLSIGGFRDQLRLTEEEKEELEGKKSLSDEEFRQGMTPAGNAAFGLFSGANRNGTPPLELQDNDFSNFLYRITALREVQNMDLANLISLPANEGLGAPSAGIPENVGTRKIIGWDDLPPRSPFSNN